MFDKISSVEEDDESNNKSKELSDTNSWDKCIDQMMRITEDKKGADVK